VSDPPPPVVEPAVEPAPEPVVVARPGFWARLLRRPAPVPVAPPAPHVPVAADPGPLPAIDAASGEAVLGRALDALGAAHHRPFSR
jgi:hypothetical protein